MEQNSCINIGEEGILNLIAQDVKKVAHRNDYNDRFVLLKQHKVLAGVLIGIVLFSVIFFPSSLSKVDTTEVAIRKNVFTGKTDLDTKYEEGLHWIGFSYKLIKFPRTAQLVTFNTGPDSTDTVLSARTKDGLSIDIDVSFNYMLNIEDLDQLYMTYVDKYEYTYVLTARSILRDVVSKYTAIQFFEIRENITMHLEESLDTALNEVFARVQNFQMTRFDLPDDFESALEQVQVAQQQYEIALHNQKSALVEAETQIFLAQKLAEQHIIEANATAQAFLIQMQAQADALNITVTADAEMLKYLADTLGLNSTELLAYLWILAISEHDSSLLIIGETTPEIIIGDNS